MSLEDQAPLLGIDLGARRVGIALSDSGVVATPHSVISNDEALVEKISRLGESLEVRRYVVGIPRRAVTGDREAGKFREFADTLRQRTCKPVVLWDEALSTVEASERLRASGRRRRESSNQIDMYAAAVILQSYLDAGGNEP